MGKIKDAVILSGGDGKALDSASAWALFSNAMEDDLDSPEAQRVLVSFANEIIEASKVDRDIRQAQEVVRRMSSVFGLRLEAESPEGAVIQKWDQHLKKFLGAEQLTK